MTFPGETSPRGSRAESRAVLLAGRNARFDHGSRQQGKRSRDDAVSWLLVSSHLGLSAIMSALFFAVLLAGGPGRFDRAPEGALRHATWFAMLILSSQVVLCACWAFALRKRV